MRPLHKCRSRRFSSGWGVAPRRGERHDVAMAYTVPDLPYPYEALEPHISAETMRFHHDKHHQTYVDKANAALAGTGLEDAPPREVLTRLTELPPDKRGAITNNVGGHFNHTLFWESMTPGGATKPARDGKLAAAIRETFGSFAGCTETIKAAALSQFGSGWAWLVSDGYRVLIVTTSNQDCPISDDLEPLLGVDVWEHAYYLDYENRRGDYVDAWLNVVNWDVVEQRYADAPVPDVADILLRLLTVDRDRAAAAAHDVDLLLAVVEVVVLGIELAGAGRQVEQLHAERRHPEAVARELERAALLRGHLVEALGGVVGHVAFPLVSRCGARRLWKIAPRQGMYRGFPD